MAWPLESMAGTAVEQSAILVPPQIATPRGQALTVVRILVCFVRFPPSAECLHSGSVALTHHFWWWWLAFRNRRLPYQYQPERNRPPVLPPLNKQSNLLTELFGSDSVKQTVQIKLDEVCTSFENYHRFSDPLTRVLISSGCCYAIVDFLNWTSIGCKGWWSPL